ncbi:MAG TPA: AraC family transcriptional regulator [Methylomusa anaerophila]|uniref:Bifunctional transcriptional activator/DNA repair enzyme AdaA n=1 Tax=Methylomusa anaerophila TaxID=1930071 RepID=A0A348ALX3_9FIRM|nr:AraC family transcriptional regulator [Methylomusa anaerophila]BBB92071.1 bifunctional transcriptional activator/DNA repair enzyme AdaA [Methylomusa anaerophila]HML87917.1 AraC family transcriptional regulator [Methylomusa anaerophila]
MSCLNNVTCERRTYTEKPHGHIHAFAQLVVPISGTLSVMIGEQSLADCCQNVIYIPPSSYHSFHSQGRNRFFVFDIPTFFLPKNKTLLADCLRMDGRWQAVRALLFDEVGESTASNPRLSDLCCYIMRLLEDKARHSASLEYMHSNYCRQITVQELAALEHYNPSYYCTWFLKHYGVSPLNYIRNLRLENAKDLLVNTDCTLMQIAQQIGYQHQSTLTRLFLAETGMAPAEFRRKNKSSG